MSDKELFIGISRKIHGLGGWDAAVASCEDVVTGISCDGLGGADG